MLKYRQDIQTIRSQAQIYLDVARYEAAENLLESSLKKYGSVSLLHNLLGLTFYKQSKFPHALEQFELAFSENPNFIEAKLNYVAALSDLGRYDQAKETFDSISDTSIGKHSQTKLSLGRLANSHVRTAHGYLSLGLSAQAVTELEKAIGLYPEMPDVSLELARLYLVQGRENEAVQTLEGLRLDYPEFEQPSLWLGIIEFKNGQHKRAVDSWKDALSINVKDKLARAYHLLAQAFDVTISKKTEYPKN